jgi:hypothetical protein
MTRLDPLVEQLAQADKAYMMLSIARTIDEQATLSRTILAIPAATG